MGLEESSDLIFETRLHLEAGLFRENFHAGAN